MQTRRILVTFFALVCAPTCGGGTDGPTPELPDVAGVKFVDVVDHPYFPLTVGMKWTYEAVGAEETEHIEVEVLAETRDIQGVKATVVHDTASVNGEIIEDTRDWFAQDDKGNVWYLGEDTCEFVDGACADRHGAWEWGVKGALPGIIMPATPAVDGKPYYQEYAAGEAEDYGEVLELGGSVTVPAGSYKDCITTHDASTAEPADDEHKHYCRGVGLVLTEEPEAMEKLIEFSG
jgi:hypothetical protein